jgi:hypothetical protein
MKIVKASGFTSTKCDAIEWNGTSVEFSFRGQTVVSIELESADDAERVQEVIVAYARACVSAHRRRPDMRIVGFE